MTYQSLFVITIDALLIAAAVYNCILGRKSRKIVVDLERKREIVNHYLLDHSAIVIDTMEDAAVAACPFCAVAAGLGEVTDQDTGKTVTAESEIEGMHALHGHPDAPAKLPCRAAKIRANARELFAEAMRDKTA